MEVVEFGQENPQSIVLIPGNMMSWRQFDYVIPFLSDELHIIAVSPDGFDGSGETTFETAEAAANKLASYIAENLGGHVNLLFGESLGCASAALLFYRQNVQMDALILNGAQYIDFGLLNNTLTHVVPKGQLRFMARARSAEKLPWLMKQFTRTDDAALLGEFDGMAENVSRKTLENAMREALRLYRSLGDYAPQPGRRVSIWYGAKEPNMKKAVAALTRVWPDAEIHPFEGMGHGEIVAHPQQMAQEIKRFMSGTTASEQSDSESAKDAKGAVPATSRSSAAPALNVSGAPNAPNASNAFWNRFAFVYDFATRDGDAGLAQAADYIADFCTSSDIVLDAACGTGAFACMLAPRVGFVAACDFAPKMVAQAQAKAMRLGIPKDKIGFGVKDITALGFANGAFDVTVAGNVLHLLDDPYVAVSELSRVVKPDGIIAIPNYVNAEDADKRFLKLIEVAGFSAKHEWNQASFLAFLEDAGLSVLDCRSFEAKQPLCVAICKATDKP